MVSLAELERQLGSQKALPPLDQWQPEYCGEMDLLIKANGDWLHQGSLIKRKAMVELFSRILRREEDEHFYLVTPVEKVRIRVEDAPLLLVDFEQRDDDFFFLLNCNRWVKLSKEHPLFIQSFEGVDVPYLSLDYGVFARANRAVFYRLIELAQDTEIDGKPCLAIVSGGEKFSIGVAD